jgi:hypothetical protein
VYVTPTNQHAILMCTSALSGAAEIGRFGDSIEQRTPSGVDHRQLINVRVDGGRGRAVRLGHG